METQFQKTPLGRVAEIVPGFAFKSEWWSDSGIPVIRIKNISEDCTIDTSDIAHIQEAQLSPKMRKFFVEDGDILVAMTGATAGKTARFSGSTPMLVNQRVAKIVGRQIDPDFLWAILGQREYQRILFHLADGAAQPNMSGGQIEALEIPVPSPDLQRQIGVIARSYDDLIEVNTHRIAILEEMARRLFDEWFIMFRFPGCETTRFVETEAGRVPQEWRETTVTKIADVNSDTVSPRDAPDTILYIDISSVSPGTVNEIRALNFTDAPGRARRRVRKGDVLWSTVRPNRRSHALLLHVEPDTIASTGFAVLRARTVPWSYLYLAVTTDEFVAYLEGRARGSAIPGCVGIGLRSRCIPLASQQTTRKVPSTCRTDAGVGCGIALHGRQPSRRARFAPSQADFRRD